MRPESELEMVPGVWLALLLVCLSPQEELSRMDIRPSGHCYGWGLRGKMPANNQSVWEVYDLLRTCRLTAKYWSARLVWIRKLEFCLEYALMAAAPGSAIAGLVFWSTTHGKVVWTILTTITALLAVAKPLLKLSERCTQLQKIIMRYRVIDCQLEGLSNDIRRENRYSSDMVALFKSLQAQVGETSKDEPVEKSDEKLRASLYEEVNKELPLTFFCEPSQ